MQQLRVLARLPGVGGGERQGEQEARGCQPAVPHCRTACGELGLISQKARRYEKVCEYLRREASHATCRPSTERGGEGCFAIPACPHLLQLRAAHTAHGFKRTGV